jgi:hypothetical protein
VLTAFIIRAYKATRCNIPKDSHFSTLKVFENKVMRRILVPQTEGKQQGNGEK